MKLNTKKLVKRVAFGALVGTVAVGVVIYIGKDMHILKEAKWTPQGDMMLTFYHRKNGFLIPKPE